MGLELRCRLRSSALKFGEGGPYRPMEPALYVCCFSILIGLGISE